MAGRFLATVIVVWTRRGGRGGRGGLSCQTPWASERRLLTKGHPWIKKEVFFFFFLKLLFNFLSAGQVLLNIKVSTICGNYTVSCFN